MRTGIIVVYVSLTRPDVYEERYHSTWDFKFREVEAMHQSFGQPPEWTVLDDDPEAHAKTDWQSAPSLVLYAIWSNVDALLVRGDTGEEVAVHLLPASDLQREHLVRWGDVFRMHELVWLHSGDLENPAYKQIVEPDSTLMKEGRGLARAVEEATEIPTYVYLPRYWGRRTDEEARRCRGCGEAWFVGGDRDEGYLQGFEFRCDACRLVSEMPSDTSDERQPASVSTGLLGRSRARPRPPPARRGQTHIMG